jgi:hypothetical protein
MWLCRPECLSLVKEPGLLSDAGFPVCGDFAGGRPVRRRNAELRSGRLAIFRAHACANPTFTLVAILTLAVGIGANTAIFSFMDAVLLKAPNYPEPDRLVTIWERQPSGRRTGVALMNLLDWMKQNTVFEGMTRQSFGSTILIGKGDPVTLGGTWAHSNYFDVFGVKAALGRTFGPEEIE